MILKYQKLARLATHTNDWLRKIAAADLEKSLYENRITTGTAIDGKCIRLSTIEKYCGSWDMQRFRQALRNKEKFSTFRFDFAVMTVRFGASRVKRRHGCRIQQGVPELRQRLLLSAYQ